MRTGGRLLVGTAVGALIGILLGASDGMKVRATPAQASDADRRAADEIRALYDDFNRAWERRDAAFIDSYFAHDPELLLFFERRQLAGWSRVRTLYENMFANASGGKVTSTASNVRVGARGNMGWLAANFELEVTNPAGHRSVDEGRQTVVYERRDGRWVTVHRHTSFQAPPGPQRHTPRHTEPGPLWDPTLEGTWRLEGGTAMMLATSTHIAFAGAEGLPGAAAYDVGGLTAMLTTAVGEATGRQMTLDELSITPTRVSFRHPDREMGAAAMVWGRVE